MVRNIETRLAKLEAAGTHAEHCKPTFGEWIEDYIVPKFVREGRLPASAVREPSDPQLRACRTFFDVLEYERRKRDDHGKA